ncbi:MAG: hypothetical protein KGL39_05210 [Patescibacteria group bacterium]|nr:hypothetical protein [Patescibacteria group bacterium]
MTRKLNFTRAELEAIIHAQNKRIAALEAEATKLFKRLTTRGRKPKEAIKC